MYFGVSAAHQSVEVGVRCVFHLVCRESDANFWPIAVFVCTLKAISTHAARLQLLAWLKRGVVQLWKARLGMGLKISTVLKY